MPQNSANSENSLNYEEIVRKYPWLIQKNQKIIIHPDTDGFLCGLLYTNFLDCKIVGYYDEKFLVIENGIDAKDCIVLDVDIFKPNIKSIGHHMVLYNKNQVPQNWGNFNNCIQLNNLRNFDCLHDFERKYPLATIHFLLGVLQSQKIINQLNTTAIWPLLFVDGAWTILFKFTENCLDWFNWLNINNATHILHGIFTQHTILDVMNGVNQFLRIRDGHNAQGHFINGNYVSRTSSRSGDHMRISNSKGNMLNMVSNGQLFDIHPKEVQRVTGFINELATHTGWTYQPNKWVWNNLNVRAFTKSDLKRQKTKLNNISFQNIVNQNPVSWAITSGQNMEYTLENPDQFN